MTPRKHSNSSLQVCYPQALFFKLETSRYPAVLSRDAFLGESKLEDFYNTKDMKAEVTRNEFTFEDEYNQKNPTGGNKIEGVVKVL